MKRKNIIIAVVCAVLTICVGVGCFCFFRYGYYSPEAKIVKQLLTGLKMNLSASRSGGYEISFRQEYEIESKSQTDTSAVDISVSYQGEGSVKLSYTLDGDEKEETGLTGLISSGNGYLSGTQREKFICTNKEDHENDEYDRADDIEYDLEHEFTVKLEGDDLFAASDSRYTDLKDGTRDHDDSFSGKIGRQLFLDSVSEERAERAMRRLLFMDAWEYIAQFGKLAEGYLEKIDFSNAKAVNDFIKEKEVAVEDLGDTALVSFVLDSAGIVADITDRDAEYLPKIYGTVELDKETGDVLHFEYDFGQYLLASLMKSGEEKPYFKADVKNFTVEGKILGAGLGDLTLDGTFVEYTEENKYDFLTAFAEYVIPFYEEEG